MEQVSTTQKFPLADVISQKTHKITADYMIEKYGQAIKIVSKDGPAFLFNPQTSLWLELGIEQLGTHIAYFLHHDLDMYAYALNIEKGKYEQGLMESKNKKDGLEDEWKKAVAIVQGYITKIFDFMPKVGNLSFVKSVAKWIANKIADKECGKLFDSCKGYLPIIGNKVVNLKTKAIDDRCFDHYFTYEIPINYIPGKTDNRVNKFFEELMLEDRFAHNQIKELTLFLQRLIGYSISGSTGEQIMTVLIGEDGSNGKTTLLKLMMECFSQITRTADKSVIMNRNSGKGPSPELHSLKSCRVAVISEIGRDEQINEPVFKRMTGGDVIPSRDLYGGIMEWIPKFCAWMLTNYTPICSGDEPTLRRIFLLSFNAKFVDNPTEAHHRKINRNIEEMFKDKDFKEAFLSWVIDGAAEYFKSGLNPPESVKVKIENYKKSQDTIAVFFEEDVIAEGQEDYKETWTSATQCYNRYVARCKSNNTQAMSQKDFGIKIKAKLGGDIAKGTTWKQSNGIKYRLCLTAEDPRTPQSGSLLTFY